MTEDTRCFVIPHSEKTQEYSIAFFECFEMIKQTTDIMIV